MVWSQVGGAIDMLENAVGAGPDELWRAGSLRRAFWYVTYHILFLLISTRGARSSGLLLLLRSHSACSTPRASLRRGCRAATSCSASCENAGERCSTAIATLTEERAARCCTFAWGQASYGELLRDNRRHVQHHVAQLHWVLREAPDSAPGSVGRTQYPLAGERLRALFRRRRGERLRSTAIERNPPGEA